MKLRARSLLLIALAGSCDAPVAPRASPGASAALSANAAAGPTWVEVTMTLKPGAAAVIEHAIKELGLGFKRDGAKWATSGRWLHPSLATVTGAVVLRVEPRPDALDVHARVEWPDGPRDAVARGEIVRRTRDLAARLALTCSEPGVATRCSQQVGGGAITDCPAQP